MPVRGTIAIVVLVAALVAGCGGGSSSTGAAKHGAAAPEEVGFIEEGGPEDEAGGIFEVGGPGPPPAGGGRARPKISSARFVVEGEMVAGEEGWVRSGVGVFWTPDGGRTWRPITPPVPHGWGIPGVYFANPRRGWALSDTGTEDDIRASMYRTTDGGRTWRHTRLRAANLFTSATQVSFSLVDGHDLFALPKVSGDTASNFGPLLVSHDSGRHWRELPKPPPEAGRISFETPRRGWLAGGHPGPALYRTVDGGRTWTEVDPGNPHATPPPQPPEGPREETPIEEEETSGLGETKEDIYTTPLIGRDGHGILGMLEATGREGPNGTPTVVWRTTDYGRSWHRVATIHLPYVNSTLEANEVLTRRGRSRSFLVHDPGNRSYTVVGPDGHAAPVRPIRGLPSNSSAITLSDTRHGLAFPSFTNRSTLSFTKDGGRDWTQVPVPRAPRWPESLAPAAIAAPRVIHRSPAAHGPVRGRPGVQAAGVCPAPKGRKVVVFLSSAYPIVPCLLVSPHQHLEIANVTGHDGGHPEPTRVETIDLAGFHARIAPGRAVLLAGPIGSYLGPGNHTVGGVTAVDIRLDHKARCEAPKPPPCPGGR